MTFEQINTFLTAVSLGSLTATAEALFISQSTASSRIQTLEEELGVALFLRGKGQRGIELTTRGRAFVPIANQWAALWQDAQAIKTVDNIQALDLAGTNTINSFTLAPLYQRHLQDHPQVRLSIWTRHSIDIHTLVKNHSVDIGFVYRDFQYPDIDSRPIFQESMYLLAHRDSGYHDGITAEELRPEDEIFQPFGPEYQRWHDRLWRADAYHALTVDTGSLLHHYLHRTRLWTIAPISVVTALTADSELTSYTLQDPPPPRFCYRLKHKYPRQSRAEAIRLFEAELEAHINAEPSIRPFEPWMLQDLS